MGYKCTHVCSNCRWPFAMQQTGTHSHTLWCFHSMHPSQHKSDSARRVSLLKYTIIKMIIHFYPQISFLSMEELRLQNAHCNHIIASLSLCSPAWYQTALVFQQFWLGFMSNCVCPTTHSLLCCMGGS